MGNSKKNVATVIFMTLIAVIGWIMMTVTSSPLMKGAAFLWLPAALQLIAGIWLGPWRGLIAGGLGAYLAGILAYGGYGLPDIIMNPIAGGLANSLLPALLFRSFKIRPDLGSEGLETIKGIKIISILLVVTLCLTLLLWLMKAGNWGYVPPILFLFIAPLFIGSLKLDRASFLKACLVCIVCCFVSAAIGFAGIRVSGVPTEGALLSSIGWFLGDVVSSFLGLVILSSYTKEAIRVGIASE